MLSPIQSFCTYQSLASGITRKLKYDVAFENVHALPMTLAITEIQKSSSNTFPKDLHTIN